jgi:hypothetical protein
VLTNAADVPVLAETLAQALDATLRVIGEHTLVAGA